MKINSQIDTITTSGEHIPLVTTSSGYYTIHLTKAKQEINNLDRQPHFFITLTI